MRTVQFKQLLLKPETWTILSLGKIVCKFDNFLLKHHLLSRTASSSQCVANKSNVILMGSPGSGKTTVGRILGQRLGLPVVDIDDHHLEPFWRMSVADKLAEVGGDQFVKAEGEALLHFQREGHVISLTGSNPMHTPAMQHISKTGVVVFLDVKNEDIAERLERMKVNRIVGQEEGVAMIDILKYRQSFYEKSYDIRVICESNETQESVADKIVKQVNRYRSGEGYVSTRSASVSPAVQTFPEVILKGLAPDGGLFVFEENLPQLTVRELERLVHNSYQERALKVLEKLIHPKDIHPKRLRSFIEKAYNESNFDCKSIFPVRHLQNNQHILELSHGPTSSFKDAALQLLPQFFIDSLQNTSDSSSKYLILVATSGDTGGAVLDGFSRHASDSNVKVMVLFPEHGISEVQKKQMTSVQGNNVHVVGVNGNFDDCQSCVKMAFQDSSLNEQLLGKHNIKLSAANSISWGRLVPQVVYHISAYLDLVKDRVISHGEEVDLCIPTGNFGNILAAYYAKSMGIPIKRLICASNSNNVLTDFINHGVYDLRNRRLMQTSSPAIDILISSNLERYIYHISDRNAELVQRCFQKLKENKCFEVPKEITEKMQSMFMADWCSEEDCRKTIENTLKGTGYLLDPHTAVAKTVGDRFNTDDRPMIIVSTAHCDKFAPELMSFIKTENKGGDMTSMFRSLQSMRSLPPAHKLLESSMTRQRCHTTVISPDYQSVVDEIMSFAGK